MAVWLRSPEEHKSKQSESERNVRDSNFLQDLRLCRDSSEPASPLGWISALTRGGKKGRIFQCRDLCTTPTSNLTGLFSQFSLFQLAIINRSLQLGSRRSRTAGAKPPASSSPLGQSSSSSLCLWLLIHPHGCYGWILPSVRTSSVYEGNGPPTWSPISGAHPCRPPVSCLQPRGGRDHRQLKRISNSKKKKRCIHSELHHVLRLGAKSKLECKLAPDAGQLDKHPPLFVLPINLPTFRHNHATVNTHNRSPHHTDKHSLRIKSRAC